MTFFSLIFFRCHSFSFFFFHFISFSFFLFLSGVCVVTAWITAHHVLDCSRRSHHGADYSQGKTTLPYCALPCPALPGPAFRCSVILHTALSSIQLFSTRLCSTPLQYTTLIYSTLCSTYCILVDFTPPFFSHFFRP